MNNSGCTRKGNKKISYNFSCPISSVVVRSSSFTNYAKYLCWFWPYAFCVHLFHSVWFSWRSSPVQHVQINLLLHSSGTFCVLSSLRYLYHCIVDFAHCYVGYVCFLHFGGMHQYRGTRKKTPTTDGFCKASSTSHYTNENGLNRNRRKIYAQHEYILHINDKMKNLRWW